MEDKFENWLIENTGMPSSAYTGDYLLAFTSAYKIELLDAEISELKKKIAELEGKHAQNPSS